MSILKNLSNLFVPVRESRRSSADLSSVNAEIVHDVNGDESAVIMLDASGATFNATYTIDGSPDGVSFYPLLCYPYAPASLGGTLPVPGQPVYTEAINAVADRMLCAAVGQLQKIRVRLSAYTAGSVTVSINSDACGSLSQFVRNATPATLLATATGAVSAAVTLTVPAVTGLRHYLHAVRITRSATAALTPSATPVLVTSTNLPGSPVWTFGSDAAGVGIDKEVYETFGNQGLGALLAGTATTVVCPTYTGVIWRVTASYRLGI